LAFPLQLSESWILHAELDLHAVPSPALVHFDLVVDMCESPNETLDREISSYYMQDEHFLDSIHSQAPPFCDLVLIGLRVSFTTFIIYIYCASKGSRDRS